MRRRTRHSMVALLPFAAAMLLCLGISALAQHRMPSKASGDSRASVSWQETIAPGSRHGSSR